ncbi:MAG: hypothetical protein Q9181_008041 [Wetmoreana brouardii]
MWRENVFVIGQGDWQDTTAFLDQMPQEACNHIRKVHLTFTIKDYFLWDQWLEEPEEVAQPEIVEDPENIEHVKFEYGCPLGFDAMRWAVMELEYSWWAKIEAITCLPLTELTLDFTDCFSFKGEWLGKSLAESFAPFRDFKIPEKLTVLAPSGRKRKQIWGAIRRKNSLCKLTLSNHKMSSIFSQELPESVYQSSRSSGEAHETHADKNLHVASTLDHPTSAQDDQLTRLMYEKLPQELVDQIQQTVFDLAFVPGFIFLQQAPVEGIHSWLGKQYYAANPKLLGVSKAVKDKYEERMWTENTYVIGTGRPGYTLDFPYPMPWKAPTCIQKVHLAFTTRSHPYWQSYSERFAALAQSDRRDDAIAYSTETYQASLTLKEIWRQNYDSIKELPLTELTLDFTDCYGFNGEWLGQEIPFWFLKYGLPSNLRILAPDLEKRVLLTDIVEFNL